MIGIYVAAILITLASLLAGRAIFALAGRADWTWLEGAVGLAALIIAAHIGISLPGGASIAVLLLALLLTASAALAILTRPEREPSASAGGAGADGAASGSPHPSSGKAGDDGWAAGGPVGTRPSTMTQVLTGCAVATILLLAAAIPFALNARTGVLGEGIYSNDHAVHLYWADWLQNGVGPKPKGIGWGYPVGPHALVATVAQATGIAIEAAFNGLMLAIVALTGLTSLAVLGRAGYARRVAIGVLVGLPFLTAAFLAQSSFKEMAIALFVLAFALSLAGLCREGALAAPRGRHPDRALVAGIVLLAGASVLTFSVPGLAWFAAGLAVWLVVELIAGRLPFSPAAAVRGLARAWPILIVGALLVGALAYVEAETVSRFADRIGEVQESHGRLARRLPPWELLGVWPQGDFRLATKAVDGAEIAILFGLLCAAVGTAWWLSRGELSVPAVLVAGAAVFVVARETSGIHVEAKALIAVAPLVMLLVVRGLLEGDLRGWSLPRIALGTLFAIAAAASTFLALRATPVGTHEHPDELALLRDEVAGKEVAYLSLDRFAPYRLRGAQRVQSPGGYIPNALRAREGKIWEQGAPVDFDSLTTDVLDRFGYAVTTGAAYGSSAPRNWTAVERTPSFVLWKRNGRDAPRQIAGEFHAPGATLPCGTGPALQAGTAGVWLSEPVVAPANEWTPRAKLDAGREATHELVLPAGRWQLSLQYNSEVPLTLEAGELRRRLSAALDGFYANAPGEGAFWPAGVLETDGGVIEVRIDAARAPELSRLVGAERHAWLGALTAVEASGEVEVPPGPNEAEEVPLAQACGGYVDWYVLDDEGL